MLKKVSIVIPTYNNADKISQVIEACLNQTYSKQNLEIIVVDDGSTDNTSEIVKKYIGVDANIKYIYQDNSGPAKARNIGWSLSNADIVFFTDSDCIPEADWVRKIVSHYDQDCIGSAGGSYDIANKESLLARCIHKEIESRHSRMPREVRALGSYNMSARKDVLEETGGFREAYTMASGEDNDLCYKILEKGYKIIFDKKAKVSHFHPERLFKYLKTQFWHGCWRVKLYIDHPGMMKGDNYSNFWDYLQPWVALFLVFLLPLCFIPLALKIIFALLLVEFCLQFPIAFTIVKKTKDLRYLYLVPVTLLRAFSRGFGMFLGVLRFVRIKTIINLKKNEV